jgi:hypothetical protein
LKSYTLPPISYIKLVHGERRERKAGEGEEGGGIEPDIDNEPAGGAHHWNLKLVHNYYYQIQGKLNIIEKSRCFHLSVRQRRHETPKRAFVGTG